MKNDCRVNRADLTAWLKRAAVAGRPKNKSRERTDRSFVAPGPRWTKKTALSKSGPAPAGMRLHFSRAELFRMYARFAEKNLSDFLVEHQAGLASAVIKKSFLK